MPKMTDPDLTRLKSRLASAAAEGKAIVSDIHLKGEASLSAWQSLERNLQDSLIYVTARRESVEGRFPQSSNLVTTTAQVKRRA